MTAVELLHKESNELITKYLDGKIDKRELITTHHNILYVHKEMEKEHLEDSYDAGYNDAEMGGVRQFDGYYNAAYK